MLCFILISCIQMTDKFLYKKKENKGTLLNEYLIRSKSSPFREQIMKTFSTKNKFFGYFL